MKITNIRVLTDNILAGLRLQRGDDFSLFLTAPLPELQEGAARLQRHFCGNHIDFAPSSMDAADDAVKTADTARRPPAITPALMNTIFSPKKKSSGMPGPIRKPAPTASRL